MRKQPFDLLTEEDKAAYCAYLMQALKCGRPQIERSLSAWNKNKRTLLRAFGGQLRYSIPIEIEKDEFAVRQNINKVNNRNLFNAELADFLQEQHNIPTWKRLYVKKMFLSGNIFKGCIQTLPEEGLELFGRKFKNGTKTIKAIGQIVKLSGYPHLDQFEQWRNQMSNITSTKKIKTNLVISIHPLDFLSLSDNNCSWHSCYSLLRNNMHKEATISHMNSNCAAVAYLESSTPFEVDGFRIPNKSYRQLIYIHKDIICAGRSYPFENKEVTKKIIDTTQELVYTNLKWTYQYPFQKYQDMKSYYDNEYFLHNKYNHNNNNQHKICLYLNYKTGYNDLIEHKDETFYCVRNWVPQNKYICVTGPVTCVVCGQPTKQYWNGHKSLSCKMHDSTNLPF